MTRNEILALAQEAGLEHVKGLSGSGIHINHFDAFTRFYTLARADYDTRLSAVMPADFKDWHEGSRSEWPELAAWVITNLREQRADLEAENAKLRQMLVSFTESDYIKKQHPKRYAVARTLLGKRND
jgi:hypothetical protein